MNKTALRFLTPMFVCLPFAAQAEPNVVVSIKPVHSLVAGVMEGVGEPELLVDGAGSPHNFALKPSQAKSLQDADLVFWVGHALEQFLEKPMETIATSATSIELIETPGLNLLEFREGDNFAAHSHGDHDDHSEEKHGHDDHGHDHDKEAHDHGEKDHDHAHEDHAKKDHDNDDHDHGKKDHDHDDHAHGKKEDGHDGHDHAGEHDPHIWLDPKNAITMVNAISDALANADAENAAAYQKNSSALIAKLNELNAEISEQMKPVSDAKFIVFHDAYPYFEARYGIETAGVVTYNPEIAPGAKRVRDLERLVNENNVRCVFSEPQFDPKIVTLLTEGVEVKTGVLDPLGADITAGPDHYFALLQDLAKGFTDCLANQS